MKLEMSLTRRMVLCSLFLVLGIVSTLIFKTIPMGSLSYLRFSLTPSLVMCASIALGPLFGLIVGVGSDLIPALLLPTGNLNFFLCIVYGLLGVLPFFLWKIIAKKPKIFANPVFISILLAVFGSLLACAFYVGDSFDEAFGNSSIWLKPLLLSVSLIMDIALIAVLWLVDRKMRKSTNRDRLSLNLFQTASVAAISDALLMTIGKSLAFYLFYLLYGSGNAPSCWYFLSVLVLGFAPSVLIDLCFLSLFLSLLGRTVARR